jgi:hypothetical protein
MGDEKNHKDARALLAGAGIAVPEARLGALTFAVVGTIAQLKALSLYDYGVTEPASRFRAPR